MLLLELLSERTFSCSDACRCCAWESGMGGGRLLKEESSLGDCGLEEDEPDQCNGRFGISPSTLMDFRRELPRGLLADRTDRGLREE